MAEVMNQTILVVSELRILIDPVIVLSMFRFSFFFVTVCGLFEWKRICAFLLAFVRICITA
jgi:hypothetical protein